MHCLMFEELVHDYSQDIASLHSRAVYPGCPTPPIRRLSTHAIPRLPGKLRPACATPPCAAAAPRRWHPCPAPRQRRCKHSVPGGSVAPPAHPSRAIAGRRPEARRAADLQHGTAHVAQRALNVHRVGGPHGIQHDGQRDVLHLGPAASRVTAVLGSAQVPTRVVRHGRPARSWQVCRVGSRLHAVFAWRCESLRAWLSLRKPLSCAVRGFARETWPHKLHTPGPRGGDYYHASVQ